MNDEQLIEVGQDVDRRYAGGFMVRDDGGELRPISNFEMYAHMAYRKAQDEAERLAEREVELQQRTFQFS